MKNKIKNKFYEIVNNKTILACALLTVVYLISGYWKWLEIGVGVLSIVFLACLPLQSSLCVFMFLHNFTFSNIIYDSYFMITLYGYVIILLVKYIIGIKKNKYNSHKILIYLICTFYAISIITGLFKPIYLGSLLYFAYLPLVYLIYEMRSDFEITQGMNFMFAGLISSSLLSVLGMILPLFQYPALHGNRFTAFINHPNYLYMRAIFILTYFMYRYLSNNLSNLKFILCYAICSAITLATLSKTGICLLALFTIIFLILFLKKDFKRNIKLVSIFMIIIIVLAISLHKFIFNIFERFADSANSTNIINSLLTGRGDIWKDYITEIFKNPINCLFGNGLLTQEVFIHAQQMTRASHNLYIFLLYRFGLLGTALLGYIIFKFIKLSNVGKPKFIAYLPLIFILVESLCDNTFKCYNFTYFIFAFMILFIDFNKNKSNPTKPEETPTKTEE